MKKINSTMIALTFFLCLTAVPTTPGSERRSDGPVYNGPELDYQPAIIRIEPSGDLMLVFERISLPSFFGDLYVAFSRDSGQTWSLPQPIIATGLNERHPALIQRAPNSFTLFYLVDETDMGDYRIHRAISSDGMTWTDQGAIDLGWSAPGEINPCVIQEQDGTLTMTYHRLYGPSYIARSMDGGKTWDHLKTHVSEGNAALPRLTKREWDSLFLVTYQVGSSNLDIFAKVSADPYDWSGEANPLSTAINSHDSQPIVLEGGTFLVTYAQQTGMVFDLYYRTSYDGIIWSDAMRITTDSQHYDTQPHPLRHGTPGHVILTWSHQESPDPYVDHDVWINTDLSIPLPLWLDTDTLSAAGGGTVHFKLNAGPDHSGRRYFLLGSMSGTWPGTLLPGGARLPLNLDAVMIFILTHYNTQVFYSFRGILDSNGQAAAILNAPGSLPLAAGTILNFAYTTEFPFDFQSNPVGILITP